MNKAEFIEAVAGASDLSRADAGRAVDAVIATISRALKKGDSVTLVGFGTFDVRKRAARTGRNPRTGAPVSVPSKRVPYFKPGKEMRERLNTN